MASTGHTVNGVDGFENAFMRRLSPINSAGSYFVYLLYPPLEYDL